jgi:hypothetical protein
MAFMLIDMHNIIVNAVNIFFILLIVCCCKNTCAPGHGCVNYRDKFVKDRGKRDFLRFICKKQLSQIVRVLILYSFAALTYATVGNIEQH